MISEIWNFLARSISLSLLRSGSQNVIKCVNILSSNMPVWERIGTKLEKDKKAIRPPCRSDPVGGRLLTSRHLCILRSNGKFMVGSPCQSLQPFVWSWVNYSFLCSLFSSMDLTNYLSPVKCNDIYMVSTLQKTLSYYHY